MALSLASLIVLSALPVHVESVSTCPSSGEVTAALAALLPSLPDGAKQDTALVERSGRQLRIELRNASGAVVAEKSLVREASCAELSSLAAVVIATWESDVHPEFARPQPELRQQVRPALEENASPRRRSSFDVALGGSVAWAGELGEGAVATFVWLPWATGPGLRISLAGETERSVALESGVARWRRPWSSAEVAWRLRRGVVVLDIHAGGLGGWLLVGGAGFADDHASTVFSPGVTAGVRVSWWGPGWLAPWLDLGGLWWLREHVVYVEPTLEQRRIPAGQFMATVGFAFGRLGDR